MGMKGFRRTIERIAIAMMFCLEGCHYAPDIASQKGQAKSEPVKVAEETPAASPVPDKASDSQVVTITAGQAPWLPSGTKLPYEYSEIVYLDGKRIGFTNNAITASAREGANIVHVKSNSLIEVFRDGQATRQQVEIESIESLDGALRRYSEVMRSGTEETETSGTVHLGALHLETQNLTAADSPVNALPEINWPRTAWGPLGVQQILLSQPMQPGQVFKAQIFVPVLHQLAAVQLTAGQYEETSLPGDSVVARLLPVDVVMKMETGTIESRNWINEAGEILKNVTLKGLNLASYRAPREVAEKFESEVKVDVLDVASVKLDRALPNPFSLNRVVYEIEAKDFDPLTLLSNRSNQERRAVTLRIAEVTVYRLGRDTRLPNTVEIDPPSDACRKPGPMIQSNEPIIEELAVALSAQATRPSEIAIRLTRGVYERIKKKNFSRGFLSAVDVAKALEGDCTEHAVLLAALLRNRGIPARLASGLVYTQAGGNPRMAYHLWVEAWIDGRWIPLDGTIGGMAGSGHIKFLETPLEGANPYAALLPVLEGMSQLSIRVLAAQ